MTRVDPHLHRLQDLHQGILHQADALHLLQQHQGTPRQADALHPLSIHLQPRGVDAPHHQIRGVDAPPLPLAEAHLLCTALLRTLLFHCYLTTDPEVILLRLLLPGILLHLLLLPEILRGTTVRWRTDLSPEKGLPEGWRTDLSPERGLAEGWRTDLSPEKGLGDRIPGRGHRHSEAMLILDIHLTVTTIPAQRAMPAAPAVLHPELMVNIRLRRTIVKYTF
jgi:hypothetical protein